MPTQALKGGNTQEFYHAEGTVKTGQKYADNGTLAKSQMQVKVHPDVSELVWKFNRWHHHVDYGSFKRNKLIRNDSTAVGDEINNYGMGLTAK